MNFFFEKIHLLCDEVIVQLKMIDDKMVTPKKKFHSLNQVQCAILFHGLRVSTKFLSMNLVQPRKFQILIANVTLSSIVGHRISFTIASLLHNEMKIVSSHTKNLKQFHMNASCMITLSCSRYRMKFKRCCCDVNFHGQLKNHTMFHMVDNSWHD